MSFIEWLYKVPEVQPSIKHSLAVLVSWTLPEAACHGGSAWNQALDKHGWIFKRDPALLSDSNPALRQLGVQTPLLPKVRRAPQTIFQILLPPPSAFVRAW